MWNEIQLWNATFVLGRVRRILRTSILAFSCDYDHAPCVMFCKKMFENLKVNYDNTFHL